MPDALPVVAICAADCIAAIEARRRKPARTVTPDEVKSTVARFHNLGLCESEAWDAYLREIRTAQWAK